MLIGLHGKKLSGKDTIGAYLVENYDFKRIGFADKLKEAVANLFDIPVERVDSLKSDGEIPLAEVILAVGTTQWSFTWREFLQRFGTEMGRNTFGDGFWVEIALPRHPKPEGNIVFTDVRFENEARRILSHGGYVIEVTRPLSDVTDIHASEQRLHEDLIDGWIGNDGSLQDLYKDVDQLMEDIQNGNVDRFGISGGH